MAKRKPAKTLTTAESYQHAGATVSLRPEIGTQAQFKKQKPPATYSYDSSLSPQLVWAGKAERQSFDVPTLPLFVHERLSTPAILQTLKGHKRDKFEQLSLFADPQHSITDQVLRAYEHRDRWTNRMVLGDSLVVMNSLVHYESLGGQVQMIYMDPPYGVKFGSNFQPFVRRRDVKHNDDEDLTREPEMVQAYRDTWELGLHSYLTYLRDRLLVARELLAPSGSLFVQISDENLHHVREVMDEVFGAENFICIISCKKTGAQSTNLISSICDYIVWYAKNRTRTKYRPLLKPTVAGEGHSTGERYDQVLLPDGTVVSAGSMDDVPQGARFFRYITLSSNRPAREYERIPLKFKGKDYYPPANRTWTTTPEGFERLVKAKRVHAGDKSLNYIKFLDDFPASPIGNFWEDMPGAPDKLYVVQTNAKVIQRCLLMTTDPGDLVLDPTCGSGTTAYVAEQWGRRWITIDVSRVPLALARQRLLTATFPWYELADEPRGPAGGFTYRRKQNSKGEETGGIVPHVTLKSIANNEPPAEEVLVDRPETASGTVRVTGPFCFEATIPTADGLEGESGGGGDGERRQSESGTHVERMLEVLRRSPVLRLGGNRTVTLKNVRVPAKSLSLSAEAIVDAEPNGSKKPTLGEVVQEALEADKRSLPFSQRPVAFVFGPENGAVSERLVNEALKEAHLKSYSHLYVIGFSIQPHARTLVENSDAIMGLSATYVQATPDLLMGDLLKNMRSSQIFSVCGLPDVEVIKASDGKVQIKLLGLDTFDPVTMDPDHLQGDNVPAWFLDTDYNDLCFHVSQAFFPRTSAWDNLKKALKGTYEESVWDHLAGTTSAPFEPGDHGQIAVKVIDDRGNELLVVKRL